MASMRSMEQFCQTANGPHESFKMENQRLASQIRDEEYHTRCRRPLHFPRHPRPELSPNLQWPTLRPEVRLVPLCIPLHDRGQRALIRTAF